MGKGRLGKYMGGDRVKEVHWSGLVPGSEGVRKLLNNYRKEHEWIEGKNQIERLRVELMRSSKRESEKFKEQKEMYEIMYAYNLQGQFVRI